MIDPAAALIPAVYERHARAWVAARRRERFYEGGWLDRFRALVPPGGRVLDLGCGAGAPMATYLWEHGLAVTGVDTSPTMVALFRQRLPDARCLVGDMRRLSDLAAELGGPFDGVLAWDSFFHLDVDDQRRMLPHLHAYTRPGAPLMFTAGPRHGAAIGQLEGEPLFHASLDGTEYRTLLDGHGFDLVDSVVEDPACGHRTIFLARRR